jgi:hypothetical protein
MTNSATEANAPAAQRQQLVEVAGIPGYMSTKEGGERSSDPSKVWDGGALDPETLSAPAETGNITVGKPYRPLVHGPILKAMDRQVGRLRTTIKIWDTDPDLGPIGEPRIHANALLVRLSWPEHDASSSDAGMFELEFAVGSMA